MSDLPLPLPLPDLVPVSNVTGDLADLALDVYRQLAAARRDADLAARQADDRIRAHELKTSRTIAALARERFEFLLLMKRLQPELDALGESTIPRLLDLFSRAWAASLVREQIEVRDLDGAAFTADVAESVEVNSVREDPSITEPRVGDTLVPLVIYAGQVVGKAVVDKVVPPVPENPS